MTELILSLLYEGESFKGLEEELLQIMREKFREFLVETLEELDEVLMKARDKNDLQVQEIRERTIVTVFGEITFERRYYYDSKEKEYRYILDEILNLPQHSRVSNLVKEKAITMVRDLSYRKSAARINDLLGGNISASSLHDWVQKLGRKKEALLKEERKKTYEQGLVPETEEDADKTEHLFIEADGVVVNLQDDGENRSYKEIKLSVAYTGWEMRYLNSKEYRVKNKKIFGGCAESDKFWQELGINIWKHYELGDDGVTVLNGDGAAWISKAERYLPFLNYRMLDSYHLQRNLLRALGRSEFLPRVRKAISEHDREKTLKLLDRAKSYRRIEKDREKIEDLKEYILNHWENMKDYRKKDISTPEIARGMGVMESNVDYILADRLKKQGISWSEEGVENISRVIIAYENGNLEDLLLEDTEGGLEEKTQKKAMRTVKSNQRPSESQFFHDTSEPSAGAAYRFLRDICRQ